MCDVGLESGDKEVVDTLAGVAKAQDFACPGNLPNAMRSRYRNWENACGAADVIRLLIASGVGGY